MTARTLTVGEWAELSFGLADALAAANTAPQIEDRPHLAARLARVRFGRTPILVFGRTIWWPNAAADLSGTAHMAVLQHELQHVLDFAEGRLTPFGYLMRPRNWSYRWELSPRLNWSGLGAEQRASVAEALWRAERSNAAQDVATLRQVIPWARADEPEESISS
jgi:hypothetical protein